MSSRKILKALAALTTDAVVPSGVVTSLTVASTATINKVVATTAQAASVVATALTAPLIVATSCMSLNSLLGTAVSVGTGGLTAASGPMNIGASVVGTTGGTTNSDALAVGNVPCNLLSAAATAAGLYYKLPTAAVGLAANVINRNSVSAILINGNSTNSVCNATSVTLAANVGAANLVCDGTNWWARG